MDKQELNTRFTYHAPSNEQEIQFYQEMRRRAKDLATFVDRSVQPSREQSLAITHLEEAVMWANAAVARRGLAHMSLEDASPVLTWDPPRPDPGIDTVSDLALGKLAKDQSVL